MENLKWCLCDGQGTCIGCLIQSMVREKFGTEGEKYLVSRVILNALDDTSRDFVVRTGMGSESVSKALPNMTMGM